MTERTFTIHREGINRFTAIVDGEEVVAVRAADYDAMETARDMLGRELDEAEAELAHIKQFLSPTGWQKAQDEHNALRAQLAEAQEELAQWRATGESVTRNEHDLSARLAEVHKTLAPLVDDDNRPVEALARYAVARIAEAEALRKDAERWRHEWQRECADTDLLLQGMGLCPSEYRSEGGSLLLGRISHKLKQRGGLS